MISNIDEKWAEWACEIKNIAAQVLKNNSKNFMNKLDLERTMSEFGKPFLKK